VASVLAVYTHFRLHGRKCVSYSRRVVFSHHHIMAASVVDVIIPSETVKFTTLKFSTQTSGPCGYSQTRIYTHLSSSGSQTAATARLIYSVVRRQSDPTRGKGDEFIYVLPGFYRLQPNKRSRRRVFLGANGSGGTDSDSVCACACV